MSKINSNLIQEDLDNLHTEISDEIETANTYSTSEILTDKVWIDGKQIYRKILTFSSISSGSALYQTFDTSSIDTITKVDGIIFDSSTYRSINITDIITFVHKSNNLVYLINNSSDTFTTACVIIEYTKSS